MRGEHDVLVREPRLREVAEMAREGVAGEKPPLPPLAVFAVKDLEELLKKKTYGLRAAVGVRHGVVQPAARGDGTEQVDPLEAWGRQREVR